MDTIDIVTNFDEYKNTYMLKQSILYDITVKTENLKLELTDIKFKYDITVGRLYLRLDELNQLIEQNIKNSKDNSTKLSESDDKKTENRDFKKEYEKIEEEEVILSEKKELSEQESKELQKIYRELVKKYHPDLVIEEKEKKERELIMQKINNAYSKCDLGQLKQYLNNPSSIMHESKETPIQFNDESELIKQIKAIENAIKKYEEEYNSLMQSPWYIWKVNLEEASFKGEDLLSELANKIKEQIIEKENELNKLIKPSTVEPENNISNNIKNNIIKNIWNFFK